MIDHIFMYGYNHKVPIPRELSLGGNTYYDTFMFQVRNTQERHKRHSDNKY